MPYIRRLQSAHRPKLLIVDDQSVNIRALHALFRAECELFIATGGAQALALCSRELPDLVLLDVVMPDMDGYEVCRRLKADPATRDIPIIFLTARHEQEDEVRGLELGAVDFISKPFHPVIVQARVRTHLALKQQNDLLRSYALVDGLTGVANRRKFDEALNTQWRRCRREQLPLSVILADVDYFKRYNDHYGHQAGDSCLQAVAAALQEQLQRPGDLLARYGGEEFVCLLPDTPTAGALRIAENLLAGVCGLGIEHADSDAAPVVTVSLGVATAVPGDGLSPQSLLEASDHQLYAAKASGRARASAVSLSAGEGATEPPAS